MRNGSESVSRRRFVLATDWELQRIGEALQLASRGGQSPNIGVDGPEDAEANPDQEPLIDPWVIADTQGDHASARKSGRHGPDIRVR